MNIKNEITITVTFQIPKDGNCEECKAKTFQTCNAFQEYLCWNLNKGRNIQLQACKDFLAKEASKVYCDGCIHYKYNQFTQEIYCTKLKLFKRENPLNCKSKEQV